MPTWRYPSAKLGSVAHQPAGFDRLAPGKDRRHSVAQRQCDEEDATVGEYQAVAGQKCVRFLWYYARKDRIDVTIGAGGEDLDPQPNGRSRRLNFLDKGLNNSWRLGIDNHCKPPGCRQQLV